MQFRSLRAARVPCLHVLAGPPVGSREVPLGLASSASTSRSAHLPGAKRSDVGKRGKASTQVGNWRRLVGASYGGHVSRTRSKPDASSAGRIATSRRADRSARAEPPAKKVAASSGRGGKGKGKGKAKSSPAARFFKLIVLLGFMACLGFGIVLVLDVGMTLIGGIHLGQITFAELVDKVHDRVFDKDVPEPAKKKPGTRFSTFEGRNGPVWGKVWASANGVPRSMP